MIVAGLLLARITRYPSSRSADGLRAAVVERGHLADDDGPGAQDEDALCRSVRLGSCRSVGRACAATGPLKVDYN
jgi:hypothetical protein